MQLGIWFEPEMVNEDALLYKEHKDWVMIPKEGRYSYGRGQLVLDFANPEVVDHIFKMMDQIILPFADENVTYTDLEDGKVYNGSILKEKGLRKPAQFNGANAATAVLHGDYQSKIFYLRKNN